MAYQINPYVFAGVSYLDLPGGTGDYATTPDSAPLDITGDIEIIGRFSIDDWTPAAQEHLISKATGSNTGTSLILKSSVAGTLRLRWTDGVSRNADSTVAVPFSDTDTGWVRVTMDVDNGAADADINFYTSTDDTNDFTAVSWTQLGTTVNPGTTTSILANTELQTVGGLGPSGTNPANGRCYRAVIRDGIGGTVQFDADFFAQTPGVGSFTENSVNAATVTIAGSASIVAE